MEAAEAAGEVAPGEGAEGAPSLLPCGIVLLEDADGRRCHPQPAEGSRHRPVPADHRRDRAHALAARHVASVGTGPKGCLLYTSDAADDMQ
eukprot:8018455-Alexandrium_andersonii.AAC.1